MKLGIKGLLLISTILILASLFVILTINNSQQEQAKENFAMLDKELAPTNLMFRQFKSECLELNLLLNNFVSNAPSFALRNKIKAKVEVEFPYFISETGASKDQLSSSELRQDFSEEIILNASFIVSEVSELLDQVVTREDFQNQVIVKEARKKVFERLSPACIELNEKVGQAQYRIDQKYQEIGNKLTETLSNGSDLITLTGSIGAALILVISLLTMRFITVPLKSLNEATERIKEGDYSVNVKGSEIKDMDNLSVAFNQMVTSLKSSFELIEKKAEELKGKNRELEQFAYIASHDLQSPLLTVSNFVGILEEDYSDKLDEEGKVAINFITESTARMKALVTGLLDYSRLGRKAETHEIDLQKTVNDVIEDLHHNVVEAEASVKVENLPSLEVYKTEIRMLFQNLISNAIKFRKPGVKPKVKISSEKKGDHYLFSVRDNGMGIPEQFKEKIFVIFQRLHSQKAYEGTGIGLAHCQKIVELHGGKIWVESEVDKGSTFYFTIPLDLHERTITQSTL